MDVTDERQAQRRYSGKGMWGLFLENKKGKGSQTPVQARIWSTESYSPHPSKVYLPTGKASGLVDMVFS